MRGLGSRPAALAMAVGALGGLLVATPAPAAESCPRELPVRLSAPTSNAAALQRVGVVRATAATGARVSGLHVTLERDGRVVAQGTRGPAFAGAVPVRLAFRRKARPGRASLVVSGRQAGCATRGRNRRTLRLDRRDLPVDVVATDRDVRAGRLAVTLQAAGKRPLSALRARLLDEAGATVSEVTRRSPLRAHAREQLGFSLRRGSAAGRHWLLVTARAGGDAARGTFADAIELSAGAASARDVPAAPPPASPAALAAPAPPPGALVQQVAVDWSGGRWQGSDSAGFSAPGIGEGQIVCRPDTQWIRVFPSDRTRDVAMTLWTFRDWDGGREFSLREAEMTQFTGPNFNEGLNKFTPTEKRSHGSFVGVVGDGLPLAGTLPGGRAPTEIRLTWSWDFTDPADARCSVTATLTSQGPGDAGPVARGLALGWRGADGVPADTTVATPVPGLGVVRLRCDARPDGGRELVVEPDVPLNGLMLTTYEGSDRSDRMLGNTPYVLPLPNNGLVEAATRSGAALRLLVASRWKVNDPDPGQNSCRLSAIVVAG